MPREPSPPPVKDPIQDDDDDGRWNWYYDDPGGGTELWFGRHIGQKLNQTSWSYLQWCRRKLSFSRRFRKAFEIYHNGLCSLLISDYDRFVVPFGKTYRGLEIRQCRDKPWLLWTLGNSWLVEKYPVFFRAVRIWVIRGIGPLRAIEYADDLDLEHEDQEGDYSDLDDFIVPDPESHDKSDDGNENTQSESEEPEAVATDGETTSRAEDNNEESELDDLNHHFWQASRTRSGKAFKPSHRPLLEGTATTRTDDEISVRSLDEDLPPHGRTRYGMPWKKESFGESKDSVDSSSIKGTRFRTRKRQREDSEVEHDTPKKRTADLGLPRIRSPSRISRRRRLRQGCNLDELRLIHAQHISNQVQRTGLIAVLRNTPPTRVQPRRATTPLRKIYVESDAEDNSKDDNGLFPSSSKHGSSPGTSDSSLLQSPSLLTQNLNQTGRASGPSNYTSRFGQTERNVEIDTQAPLRRSLRALPKIRLSELSSDEEEEEIPRAGRASGGMSPSNYTSRFGQTERNVEIDTQAPLRRSLRTLPKRWLSELSSDEEEEGIPRARFASSISVSSGSER